MSNRAIYELLSWPEDPILDDAPVTAAGRGSARWEAAGTPTMEPLYPRPKDPWGPERATRDTPPPGPSTGKLAPVVDALAEPAGARPERIPQAPRSSEEKQFTLEQEMRFVRLYRANQNIRECLRAMQLGNRYYACASRLVEARKLRKV